ncbi:MAG: hypothetical protein PHR81_09810 [Bacteroidales bacterium]|jgi:hypothetical protein|nr:hypothetical protein [Bacteroidales bacterium]MDD4215095.1 hypothetical protein [Bacteroidales bacterium]
MKKILILCLAVFIFAFANCKKCYDCTKKCGICTKEGFESLAGCQGDSSLNGHSVEAWKLYFENQGYTCVYDNVTENVCGDENKEELSGKNYECLEE